MGLKTEKVQQKAARKERDAVKEHPEATILTRQY